MPPKNSTEEQMTPINITGGGGSHTCMGGGDPAKPLENKRNWGGMYSAARD